MQLREDFSKYYDENIKAFEEEYNFAAEECKKQKKIIIKKNIFLSILVLIFILIACLIIDNYGGISEFYLYICLMILIWVNGIINHYFIKREFTRTKVVNRLKQNIVIPFINSSFSNSRYFNGNIESEPVISKIFGMARKYKFGDTLSSLKNYDIKISELVVTGCGNRFEGVFAKIKTDFQADEMVFVFPESLKMVTTIKENSPLGELVNITDIKNKNKINLEDTSFEKYFKVYCKNPIKARMVLTPDIMENLACLQSKYENQMRFSFYKNYVYIAIDGIKIIDEDRLFEQGLSKENLYYTFKLIENILESIKLAF